ncbi:hypothetical protein NDU88_001512 [Pleurodeles waltl]|uniref:Uncharacterized protein n=1 Tax=Pleurodeles waltl TaxID=8319 RepID=A0AAV7TJW0_PLEWA|nr:hypothetical protein NDU88_001512 [Pleurodeles waltl]
MRTKSDAAGDGYFTGASRPHAKKEGTPHPQTPSLIIFIHDNVKKCIAPDTNPLRPTINAPAPDISIEEVLDRRQIVKVTEPKEAATQEQEKPPEQAPEEPPPYGIHPTLPAAGYQDPERVEPEEDRTDVKGAGRAPSPNPTPPWVDHEQKRRDRATPKLRHTKEQAGRSRSLDPIRGQWTIGQIILKLGNTLAETLREAAGEWMQEEREWVKEMERSRYDERRDEMERGAGAEVEDEEWDEGFELKESTFRTGRRLYNFLTADYTKTTIDNKGPSRDREKVNFKHIQSGAHTYRDDRTEGG